MRSLRSLLWIGLAAVLPASAQFIPISTPTAQYTGNTTVIPVAVADFSSVSSLSGGGKTVTLTPATIALTTGTTWNFWGSPPNTESSTPRVIATDTATVTLALSTPSATFGFELEPANVAGSPFSMTATFYNGLSVVGTVTRTIAYNGSLLMAASSTTPITSVVVTAPAGAGGFAIAQIRFGSVFLGAAPSTVPALGPAGLGTLGLMLAGAGSWLARRGIA